MAQEPHPPFGNEETMEVSRGELKKELARQTPLSHLADRSKKFTPLPSSSSSPPVEDPLLRLKSLVDKYKQEDHPKTLPSPLPPQQSFLPSRPSSLYSPFSGKSFLTKKKSLVHRIEDLVR
jgi:hypothetical protein